MAYPEHPLAPWAPWSQFLPVLDVSKLGHTASKTLSSPRSETLPTLAFDWPECSSFTQFRCPLTPDPAEITLAHFDSCIDPLILLAHQAMQLSTFSRAEIWHRFCGNYFLPESTHFTPFLQPYVPSPGMHPVWKHKHSNVSVEKTAILEGQSGARDLLYFLGRHWLRHFVRFYNHRTMATSSLATSVAAASPVPLPREPQPNGQDMMLDPALPNLLLDSENLAKFELSFPGHDFASLVQSTEKLRDFQTPIWPLPLPSIQNEIVTQFRKAAKEDLPEVLAAVTLLASEQLEQSKRMATTMADTMTSCSDLIHESQVICDDLEALLERLTAVDAVANAMAFPYRLSLQQMLLHLPTHVARISAAGKTANDTHLTLTRHLLIQSHRVAHLTSDDVKDRVTQGRTPRILGLSNEAYALDHLEWLTASAETIARIRSDGPQRQRRQEPFALLPPLEQAYPLHCDSEHISLQGVDPY